MRRDSQSKTLSFYPIRSLSFPPSVALISLCIKARHHRLRPTQKTFRIRLPIPRVMSPIAPLLPQIRVQPFLSPMIPEMPDVNGVRWIAMIRSYAHPISPPVLVLRHNKAFLFSLSVFIFCCTRTLYFSCFIPNIYTCAYTSVRLPSFPSEHSVVSMASSVEL